MKTHALITGASAGIGRATAKKLAEEGRNLILFARREQKLSELKQELESSHDIDVVTHVVDVTDHESVERAFDALKDKDIDVLVNNAGLALSKEPFDEYDFADFQRMVDTNIVGFLKVAQLCIPFLKKTNGYIVNISSIAGIEAYEGGSVYCATKSFVKMISKSLRIDLAGTGIRVTDIAPGAVETEFSNVRFKSDGDKAKKVYEGYEPLHPEDIADAIAYVLSTPAHVNVEYMLVMPTAQASAGRVAKR